jgi:hypothetical protein
MDMSIEYNRDRDYYWNPDAIETRVKGYVKVQQDRNEIITSSPIKLDAIIKVFKKYPLPCICYNDNAQFSDIVERVTMGIGAKSVSYHSKCVGKELMDYTTGHLLEDKRGEIKHFGVKGVRKYIAEGFANGTVNFVSCVEVLDEALTLSNAELIICSTGSINPVEYRQRIYKSTDIDPNNPDKRAKVFNLYFDDFSIIDAKGQEHSVKSRDKAKLILRQKDSDHVTWLNIDDI